MNVLTEIARGVVLLLIALGIANSKPRNPYWKDLGKCRVKLFYAVPGKPEKGYKMLTIDDRNQVIYIELDSANKIKAKNF